MGKSQKKYSSKRRRRDRIKQNNLASDIMDDDDLILHEIASKKPISTKVSNTLKFESDMIDFDDDDSSYSGDSSHSFSLDHIINGVRNGNEGDDEDDDDSMFFEKVNASNYNINDKINNLPESTLINSRPFIINSKNKRIRQLESIIIELCKKYILSSSQFQLNLAKHIRIDIETKIELMMELNDNKNKKQKQFINHYEDSDDSGPHTKLSLMNRESNASIFYPEQHEKTLSLFFDHTIQSVLRLMNDSFVRLQSTEQYKQFIKDAK